jgi:hypothetical protein
MNIGKNINNITNRNSLNEKNVDNNKINNDKN